MQQQKRLRCRSRKFKQSPSCLKLTLSRHWFIFDSNGTHREVEGEGVIGVQPILEPGEIHEYVSGCNLKTEMGKMWGAYTFKRIVDEQLFDVQIPEFQLLCSFKLN